MDDAALRSALKRLLAHGEAAKDQELVGLANAKKAPAAEACPECHEPMEGGKCAACGFEAPASGDGDGELAELLESGARE